MREVKCKSCGAFTKNSDYCGACGALINYEKIRADEIKKIQENKAKEVKKPSLVERMKYHDLFIVRVFGYLLYVVWIPFMAIGAFLAWLIAAIAA